MKNSIFLTIILISFLIAPVSFGATPQISGISGVIESGSILKIDGQYLMDENKTSWLPQFKTGTKYGFEGADYLSDGYTVAPDGGRHEPIYDTNIKISGGKSYQGRIHGAYTGPGDLNGSSGAAITTGFSRADLYVRLYSRWNSVGTISKWPTSHIKMVDMQGSSGVWQYYFQPAPGNNLPSQMLLVYDGVSHAYNVSNFLINNRWYCMEARFKNTEPYNFTAWVDGVLVANATPTKLPSSTLDYILFNMINLGGTGPDFDLYNWTDNFTVSTSRINPSAVVEVGNSSDYATAIKTYQEPISIEDTSTKIKLNLSGLGPGPYYLWVTNNRQERSIAYPIGETSAQRKGDLNNDNSVNVTDLGILLGNWNTAACPEPCRGDINQDGKVDVTDLGILLSNWG